MHLKLVYYNTIHETVLKIDQYLAMLWTRRLPGYVLFLHHLVHYSPQPSDSVLGQVTGINWLQIVF